ncbi:AMP-binding protein [Bosea psychrotolerans]|uniref:Acyl-[acyl-carrier-protein]-phospholipid O-acyltransferase/long-chain-fatty-acid--[acyl-carrier-protein] ligase n=1 Tax=Bosea psychrotolerans TaxID=1871628 RepID=A0A2S4MH61_9HYPH|nr:AMP-binding protein [Bosea psychrotolerans]POR54086.1 acyl-[acyl-carrier-protein]-phospholipid O-acyltransferase/long-chain-fatty-acid--[acyl-carrier-protein] ligase [Bosea psychrotolerans]
MADTEFDALSFDAPAARITLFRALIQASTRHGRARIALEDPERQPISFGRLVLGALVLGRKLAGVTQVGERVGLLLPNMQGMVVTLFGLSAFGRVPAFLNFTAGVKNLRAAAELAGLKTIITSRRFIDQAKLDDEIAALSEGRRVIYLEEVRKQITSLDKAYGALLSLAPGLAHRAYEAKPDDAAVVLFTSGTEGKPKGVVLSHANLVSNARQIFQLAAGFLSERDIVMNPLPAFHSFGLTAGLLMPLLQGMKVVLYPSPLHYKQVPRLIGEMGCSFLFATDTFLQGYARAADPDDLKSVRYVVAGAERVKPETRRMWEPYGTTILEGYGCTECSPVLACNTPVATREGSVGRLLPGIEARLDPVEGITEGGKLCVRGPNVMAGYLSAEEPGRIVPPEGGWHDTGDIVAIDDGFVVIKGRAKRFAKLGGEMVSLAAVEAMIAGLWPEQNHVVVALPDARKGEQLVLVTEKPDAEKRALLDEAKAQGFPELWVPRAILVTNSIPVLGNGKIDYGATRELAASRRSLL